MKEPHTMPTNHRHGDPALTGHLARIEQRGTRHRAAAIIICFCLPAIVAVTIAAAAVVSPSAPAVVEVGEVEAVAP